MTRTTINGTQITDNSIESIDIKEGTINSIDVDNTIEILSNKGSPSGYAPLDLTSKIPTINLGGDGANNSKFLRGDQTWSSITLQSIQIPVDFGYINGGENDNIKISISAPWVTSTTKLICSPSSLPTVNHDPDDYAIEGISSYSQNIIGGIGFDLITVANNNTFGTYIINIIGV